MKYKLVLVSFCFLFMTSCSDVKKVIDEHNTIIGMDGQSKIVFEGKNSVIYSDYAAPGDELVYYGTYSIKNKKVNIILYDTLTSLSTSIQAPQCSLLVKKNVDDSIFINCTTFIKETHGYQNDYSMMVYVKENGRYKRAVLDKKNYLTLRKKNESIDLLFKTMHGLNYELSLFPLWDYDITIYYDYDWILFTRNRVITKALKYKKDRFYSEKYFYEYPVN